MFTLKELLDECRREAISFGLDPADPWDPAPFDLDYITAVLGYKPTREEWRAAGLRWVGDAHVSESARDVECARNLSKVLDAATGTA